MDNPKQCIAIVFADGGSFFSKVVKWFTNSEWSHVAIRIDNHIYESQDFKGVVKTPVEEFTARYIKTEEVYVRGINRGRFVKETLRSYLANTGYDWKRIIGYWLDIPWLKDKNKLTCDEYVAKVLELSGKKIYKYVPERGLSPQTLWAILAHKESNNGKEEKTND